MNALKTFLEKADKGGWYWEAEGVYVLDISDENIGVLVAVFNPEAAKAFMKTIMPKGTRDDLVEHGANVWQHCVLNSIQNGLTPVEAVEKEL